MPTVDIPDKICPHCGGVRWKIEYEQRPYHVKTRYRCAKKAQERRDRWAMNHPEKEKEYAKKRRKDYKSESYRKYQLNKYYYHRDNLTDHHIKHLIAHQNELSMSDVPQELIKLKRKELLLKRQIKNNGKS